MMARRVRERHTGYSVPPHVLEHADITQSRSKFTDCKWIPSAMLHACCSRIHHEAAPGPAFHGASTESVKCSTRKTSLGLCSTSPINILPRRPNLRAKA